MTAFTKVNLKALEAGGSGNVESRFARKHLESEHLGINYFRYAPGRTWDVVRVAPATVRALEAGPEGLEVLAVGSDRPEGGDGERVEGWWID
jgi:hypothetical protein